MTAHVGALSAVDGVVSGNPALGNIQGPLGVVHDPGPLDEERITMDTGVMGPRLRGDDKEYATVPHSIITISLSLPPFAAICCSSADGFQRPPSSLCQRTICS